MLNWIQLKVSAVRLKIDVTFDDQTHSRLNANHKYTQTRLEIMLYLIWFAVVNFCFSISTQIDTHFDTDGLFFSIVFAKLVYSWRFWCWCSRRMGRRQTERKMFGVHDKSYLHFNLIFGLINEWNEISSSSFVIILKHTMKGPSNKETLWSIRRVMSSSNYTRRVLIVFINFMFFMFLKVFKHSGRLKRNI